MNRKPVILAILSLQEILHSQRLCLPSQWKHNYEGLETCSDDMLLDKLDMLYEYIVDSPVTSH